MTKHFSKRLYVQIVIAIALIVMLSSCSSAGKPEVSEGPAEVQQKQQTPPAEEAASTTPMYTAPLTGMPMEQLVQDRPLAVMINNAPAARPQSGLSKADVVYEVPAEGGITRFVAIFQSHKDINKIGPIRSIRPYLIEIGESYHGVLVHAGGSTDAYAILQKQKKEHLDEITNAGAYFWREKDRKAPHNLYSSIDKLRKGADKHGYEQQVSIPAYTFRDETEEASGESAKSVQVKFIASDYVVGYDYDEQAKVYKRSINGKPHIDLNTNEQLSAANVIIMGADIKVLDKVGRLSIDLDLGGEAILLQRGKMLTGQWVRSSGDIIRFVKDGKEVPLYAGQTYYNIVPSSPAFAGHVTIKNQ
ncbi:DUF3048 domain-containing protein [Paenibacillus sediminis]|uniref:DUF3048 domain-containing protein n=1 Tax=Paenibacillus sediminis TaxID=664909 RepID=A0ABS4H6I5_9BACL|nr:DUF3048 domain-containing protein [Paenibacillus sediminis]MBP1937675.1 hypothetical protein [Paenibacillus sediminis]